MRRLENLYQQLQCFEFTGKANDLESLFTKIQDLRFHFEAQGMDGKLLAAEMECCAWDLKTRIEVDQEVQWIWTFEWMKNKLLRKLEGFLYPAEEIVEFYTEQSNQELLQVRETLVHPMPSEFISSSKLNFVCR